MKPVGLPLLLLPLVLYFFLPFSFPNTNRTLHAVPEGAPNPYYIVVDKSDYELKVYDDEGWLATYPVVFGSNDMRDKYMEGDKRTPEGQFKVLLKKIHPKWGPELLLDFPNKETMKKFDERKGEGLVPKTAV